MRPHTPGVTSSLLWWTILTTLSRIILLSPTALLFKCLLIYYFGHVCGMVWRPEETLLLYMSFRAWSQATSVSWQVLTPITGSRAASHQVLDYNKKHLTKMAQWLRVLIVLPEDIGSIPSAHMVLSVTLVLGDLMPTLGFLGLCTWYIHAGKASIHIN